MLIPNGYPLTITVIPEDELNLRFEYDQQQLTAEQIQMMQVLLGQLLEQIAVDAQQPLQTYQTQLAKQAKTANKSRQQERQKAKIGKLRNIKRKRR